MLRAFFQVDDSVVVTYNEYDTPQGVSYRREGYTGIVCTVDGGVVEVVLDCDGSVVKLARNTYCARLAVGDPTASLWGRVGRYERQLPAVWPARPYRRPRVRLALAVCMCYRLCDV